MLLKHSCYEYEIFKRKAGWEYRIQDFCTYYMRPEWIESDEWYDTSNDAEIAAINHIDHLESGGDHE